RARPDRPVLRRCRPQLVDGDPGGDPDRGRDVRQPRRDAQGAGMTASVGTSVKRAILARIASLAEGGWRRIIRDQPIIPLLILLAVLVAVLELAKPGIVSGNWLATTIRAATPLAILAGCQTMAMLTGGIDLSVGAVASMAGFVVASLVNGPGLWVGLAVALTAALLAGLLTGVGVGIFRVHLLIMSL